MCLTAYLNKKIDEKASYATKEKEIMRVAKRNITVYKVLEQDTSNSYYSPHRAMEYTLNTHYYQTGKYKFGICIGFSLIPKVTKVIINKGLHAYTNLTYALNYLPYGKVVVRCIIPKGSLYLKSYDEIVSDNLILTNKIYS